MIGVARCSSSMPTPTPVRMSGRASTTTYVSAAVTRTARVARTTIARRGAAVVPPVVPVVPAAAGSAGGRCGDLDIFPELAEVEGVGPVVLGGEEGAGQLRAPQLTAVGGDGEPRLHRLARV